MTTRSVRTQLLLGIGGVVMLTVLLFAVAVWRLILLPAENENAARDMRHEATAASSQVRSLVEGVEHIVETARQWGRSGQLSIGDHEQFNDLVLPLIRNRPEIDAVLFASEDGRETFLLRTERGWDNRLTDVAKRDSTVPISASEPSTPQWRASSYLSRSAITASSASVREAGLRSSLKIFMYSPTSNVVIGSPLTAVTTD